MRLADLPSSIRPPAGHRPDKVWRRARRHATRREFIRLVTGASLATGLAFASLMPTARRAYATDETPTDLWSWNENGDNPRCHGPTNDPTLDYAGNTGCCACGSIVSSGYCGSDDWHKHHPEFVNSDIKVEYWLRNQSCGRETPKQDRLNAWEWKRDGTVWRCSDGKRRYCVRNSSGDWECSSESKTVCPATV